MSGAQRHANGAWPPTSQVGSKEYLVEVLTDWFANRKDRTSEYMTPEEIGACENRAALLLQAIVIGIVCIYREALFSADTTESADDRARGALYRLGVFVVYTYLSNGKKGYSTASAKRVAELLCCGVNSVLRARTYLIEKRILAGGRKGAHSDRYWPVISRKAAADTNASPTWLLDATSEPVKMGRPRKTSAPDAGRKFDEESFTPDVGRKSSEQKKVPPPNGKVPPPNGKVPPRMRGDETQTQTIDFLGARARESSQSKNDSTTKSSPPRGKPSAGEAAFAERNVWVTNLGDLEIGPELLGHLTGTKGFTEEEIHLALPRALQRAGDDRSPVRLLGIIHEQLSYLRQDTAKRRAQSSKAKPAPCAAPAPATARVGPGWWRGMRNGLASLGERFWRDLIVEHTADGRWPVEFLGPPPGDPGCVISETVQGRLAELLAGWRRR